MIDIIREKYRDFSTDKRFSEIFTGTLYAMGARVGVAGLALISSIIVARVYGAELTGILAMVNSFMVFAMIFAVMGTDMSILRLIPEHMTKYSDASAYRVYGKAQVIVLLLSSVTAIVLFLLSDELANRVFAKPGLSFYFALSAVFIVVKANMDFNAQAVRSLKLIRTFSMLQILPHAVMVGILIGAVCLGSSHDAPVYAQLSAWTVTSFAGYGIMRYSFRARVRSGGEVCGIHTKNILAISAPMMMVYSMSFLIGQTGIVILGIYHGESMVGHYSVAVKLSNLTTFILQAINTLAAPKFSELYHAGKLDELFYVARKSSRLIFWLTFPVLLGLIVLGKPLLARVFGEGFSSGYVAMVLLVIGQFVNSIAGSTGDFLNMTGREKVLRNIMATAAIVNVVLCLVLVPRYGMSGAAIAAMTTVAYWNLHVLYYIKVNHGRTIAYLPFLVKQY